MFPGDQPTHFYVDFDGTIAMCDVGDRLSSRFAGAPGVDLADRYVRGEITSAEYISRQVDLYRGTEEEVHNFVLKHDLDPMFSLFVEQVRSRSNPITILSDGLKFYIDMLLEKHGIADLEIFSNHGYYIGEGRWGVDFPYLHPECEIEMANCKCSHIKESGTERRVYIGNGHSDLCPSQRVDLVYAKEPLASLIDGNGVEVVKIDSFADVLRCEFGMETESASAAEA